MSSSGSPGRGSSSTKTVQTSMTPYLDAVMKGKSDDANSSAVLARFERMNHESREKAIQVINESQIRLGLETGRSFSLARSSRHGSEASTNPPATPTRGIAPDAATSPTIYI